MAFSELGLRSFYSSLFSAWDLLYLEFKIKACTSPVKHLHIQARALHLFCG